MNLLLALFIGSGTAAFAGFTLTPFPCFPCVTFDNLQVGEQVLSFYDGGFGGNGSGPGPSYGVSFTDGLAADSAQFAFGQSARLTAPMVTMNLDNPWDKVISFYFRGSGAVRFYSGPDASGSLQGFYQLSGVDAFGVTPGTFRSVVFSGAGLQLDSITFGVLLIPALRPDASVVGDRVACRNAPLV